MAYLVNIDEISSYVTEKLNIFNWKSLQKDGTGVIILVGAQVYKIHSCTLNEIYEINEKPKRYFIKKRLSFLYNRVPCRNCWGTGRFDWISEITKPSHPQFHKKLDRWRRDPKGIITKVITDFTQDYFLSSPYLRREEVICKKCLGGGIHRPLKDALETQVLKGNYKFPSL